MPNRQDIRQLSAYKRPHIQGNYPQRITQCKVATLPPHSTCIPAPTQGTTIHRPLHSYSTQYSKGIWRIWSHPICTKRYVFLLWHCLWQHGCTREEGILLEAAQHDRGWWSDTYTWFRNPFMNSLIINFVISFPCPRIHSSKPLTDEAMPQLHFCAYSLHFNA